MNKILTIVVPVYKVEPYINKCLDSLILQDEKKMEKMDVLIVNDGTPDRSAEMSREYVKRYPQTFRQIDKENGGHGSVWNLGLIEAQGKYLHFLDSDDWFETETLSWLIDELEHQDADMVITPTLCHCPENELWKLEIKDMEFGKVYDADKFDWLGNRSHGNYIFHHCATYKTEMFRPLYPLFLEHQPYDDVILGVAPIYAAKSLVAFDKILYHYLMDREGQSISSEVRKRNQNALFNTKTYTIRFIEEHPITDKTSTKYAYFKVKLPKRYSSEYKPVFEDGYSANKQRIAKWDRWVRLSNPKISSKVIKLYRLLPFCLYWIICKLVLKK